MKTPGTWDIVKRMRGGSHAWERIDTDETTNLHAIDAYQMINHYRNDEDFANWEYNAVLNEEVVHMLQPDHKRMLQELLNAFDLSRQIIVGRCDLSQEEQAILDDCWNTMEKVRNDI